MRNIFSILTIFVLISGCSVMDGTQGGRATYVYAQALYAEPVFDNDVISFTERLTQFTHVAGVEKMGFTDRRLTFPTIAGMRQTLNTLANSAKDGQDVVVVMMTTHGNQDVLAVKYPNADIMPWQAASIAKFLEPLNNDLQIIILQACYSGSLIDDLKHPNRVIITAAAENRTSFGCAPKNKNTWFIESLNTALANGGAWADVFSLTQAIVRQKEQQQGIKPSEYSNPSHYVGANMRDIWFNG